MAKYRSGTPLMVDYTPSSAKTAGDVVVVGEEIWIVHTSIAANELGAAAAPGGDAVYLENKLSTDVVAAGDELYWDAGNSRLTKTASTHKKAGVAVEAAGNGGTTVQFRHERLAPDPEA